jgi:hypothetical protein
MWRKRSMKSRYWNVLRRFRFIPGLAALTLSGCASPPAPSSSAEAVVGATTTPAPLQPDIRQRVREQFDPRWWPVELMLTPDLRAACRPFVELPSHLLLNDETEQAEKLEPLVTCLTLAPTKARRVHLAGEIELPGAVPPEDSGHAAALRSTLAKLGVPLEQIQTRRVDTGRSIEVGIEPRPVDHGGKG